MAPGKKMQRDSKGPHFVCLYWKRSSKSSKLVETQAATFNSNPRSPPPSPALDRPIYQWTENTLSLRAKPALLRSMSFPQKDEAILEAWQPKTDDFVALLQGPGTRLLNLVAPPFSGKSTPAPAILRRISANTSFVFIYVAKTQLDVETLSRECAPEQLLRDGLPGLSVVFINEDPEASVSYVMAWLSLCICAAKQTDDTRLRIVAISEAEPSPWQRASLTNLGKVSTEQMTVMKAPFRSMLDPEAFPNNFVDTSQPAEKRVLLFYGDHATLAWWLKGMTPKTGRPPVQVLRIRDTSSTTTINRFINRVARARPGDRLAVCFQPGIRISSEQASKFQFTHVLVYGRYTQGVVFSRVTGNFVNAQDASKPAYWEVLRILTLGSSYEVLPATSIFCPGAPFSISRRDETQLYRQKDLPAFVLSCVDLAEHHNISFSHLMEAFSEDLEPDIGVEMLRRLSLAGLVDSPGPGEFHPSPSMRARGVCEWLPLTRNSAAAARLMAGLKLYANNIPLQRTIMAMAIVFAYSNTPFFKLKDECLLSPSDISSRLTAFFYKEGESAAIPLHQGYLWYALEIFLWAINIGDVGKLNKGGKLCLPQVLEVDEGILGRMYAHYLCIAAKVGHGNGSQDDALNLSPINSSDASSLHDELLYCSLDQLYWIDDMGNPEWPPHPKARGHQTTIMDLVSSAKSRRARTVACSCWANWLGPEGEAHATGPGMRDVESARVEATVVDQTAIDGMGTTRRSALWEATPTQTRLPAETRTAAFCASLYPSDDLFSPTAQISSERGTSDPNGLLSLQMTS
ncbi:hypothetical protein F5X68DRAFT_233918 [Plectosphaerella plurivora]|uniref:Uncharacterized protein n=1 Tax=Plectosphaerella plurivora TaxID=936078 RepID=A0A9P8V873_9PEZI|nr:hypothetical protein F5X68DRAFT_233918 [Plectosphaerella plurivora]